MICVVLLASCNEGDIPPPLPLPPQRLGPQKVGRSMALFLASECSFYLNERPDIF